MVTSQKAIGLTKGSQPILPSIDNTVRTVLGHGYDITGRYAHTDSFCEPVMDLVNLNKYGRIEKNPNSSYEGRKISGSGSEEYTSKLTSELKINVSAKAFGVKLSSETKKTFSEDRYKKNEYKFLTVVDVHRIATYKIQGYRFPGDILGFLTEDFRRDLNSKTATDIVKNMAHMCYWVWLGVPDLITI